METKKASRRSRSRTAAVNTNKIIQYHSDQTNVPQSSALSSLVKFILAIVLVINVLQQVAYEWSSPLNPLEAYSEWRAKNSVMANLIESAIICICSTLAAQFVESFGIILIG